MSRYQAMFNRLKQNNEGAFVPFVMLGDPDKQTSIDIIVTLIENGADALELGFPYSDPIADGPTIQKAGIRALNAKTKVNDCFQIIDAIRRRFPDIPIGLLLYTNLVLHRGTDTFYQQASQVGVDSVLLADVPLRESAPFRAAANQHGIDHILIAPPNADNDALQAIANHSQGYTYLLGRAGVTGTENQATTDVSHFVARLTQMKAAPAIIGFGISTPAQVKSAIDGGAAGAIAGSATVKIIEQFQHDKSTLLTELGNFTRQMKAATR